MLPSKVVLPSLSRMSVFVSNLDDFISPSQACVNPLVTSKLEVNEASTGKRALVSLANDYSISEFSAKAAEDALSEPNLIKMKRSNEGRTVATVSVADCLACRY